MEEEKLKKGLDKIYDLLNVACGNCVIEDNERESLQDVVCYIEKRYEQLEKENKKLKESIMNAMGVIYRDFEYDDGDFENQRFQQDILKELRGDNNGTRESD